jgi:glucose uptake protein GlcU
VKSNAFNVYHYLPWYDWLMDFLFPLAHAISESTGKTIDKLNFRRNHISSSHLIWLVFVAMSVSISLFIVLSGKPFPHISYTVLGIILLIAIVSFLDNVFDFASLKVNDLSLREPMLNFTPILAGLVGYILFPAERKPGYLLAFLIGAIVVLFGTHRRKLRPNQKKGMYYLLVSVCLSAFLPTIYKWSLEYMSPEYSAFFRVTSVLLLASIFLPVKKSLKLSRKTVYGLSSGAVYAIGTVTGLYAIQKLGVVVTMLLFMLEPALKYAAGYFILSEKVRKGEIVSSIVLIGIIIVAVVK